MKKSYKNAAIYVRTACESDQAIAEQILACMSYTDSMGWRVVNTHVFSDAGISGATTTGGPGLNRLLEAAKLVPQVFGTVVITEPTRLGRNPANILSFVDTLKFHGVSVSFVDQKVDSFDEHFHDLLTLPATSHQNYHNSLSQLVRRGQAERVIAGFTPGGRCYGYDHFNVEDPHP
jgi:DNA invertase Pin-like site-specific DNA recombinase